MRFRLLLNLSHQPLVTLAVIPLCSSICCTKLNTCFWVWGYPILAHFTRKLASSSSSSIVKYGSGPGFLPCWIFPDTLSCSVDLGTPHFNAALLYEVPWSTKVIAVSMLTSFHILYCPDRPLLESLRLELHGVADLALFIRSFSGGYLRSAIILYM